jgi:hypothetical protein
LSRHTPGDAVTLRVQGRSEAAPREIRVTLVPDPRIELVTIEDAGGRLDEAQRAFREAWLGAK